MRKLFRELEKTKMNVLTKIRADYYYKQSLNLALAASERHNYAKALFALLKSL
jgi:hypothetical protein